MRAFLIDAKSMMTVMVLINVQLHLGHRALWVGQSLATNATAGYLNEKIYIITLLFKVFVVGGSEQS